MRCGTLGMHARHLQLIYSCFFSSLNKPASYSRTTHLASSRLLGYADASIVTAIW